MTANSIPAVDLVSLYPPSCRPTVLLKLRQFYIDVYQDKLFMEPPLWGTAYIVMEAVYHLPLSIWVIRALWRSMLSQGYLRAKSMKRD